MEKHQIVKNIKGEEKKRKLKEHLKNLKENIQLQNKHYYNLYMKANEDMIKALNDFIKSQITYGQLDSIIKSRIGYYEKLKKSERGNK